MLNVSQHCFTIALARISVAAGAGGFNDKAIPPLKREVHLRSQMDGLAPALDGELRACTRLATEQAPRRNAEPVGIRVEHHIVFQNPVDAACTHATAILPG